MHSQSLVSYIDIETILGSKTFTYNLYFLTLLCGIFYCLWTQTVLYGCANTVQSHAYTLSSLHGILLIPIMTIRKGSKHKIEKLFCILILGAIVLILIDR